MNLFHKGNIGAMKIKAILNFKDISLKTKLIVFFVVISLIPTIIIGFVSYKVSESIIKDREIENNMRDLKDAEVLVPEYLNSVLSLGLKLAENKAVISFALENKSIVVEQGPYNSELASIFDEYSNNDQISSIYVFDNHGNMVTNDKSRSVSFKSIISNSWYPETISKNKYIWGEPKKPNGINTIPLYVNLRNPADGSNIGLLLINVKESYVYNLYNDFGDVNGETIILNENNNIVSCRNKYQLRMGLHDVFRIDANFSEGSGYYEQKVVNEMFLVTYYKDAAFNWTYLSIERVKVIVEDIEGIKQITILLCTVCLIITSAFSFFLSARLTKPLKKLVNVMEEVRGGNMSIRANFNSKDEIGHIGNAFDSMAGQLQEHISHIYDDQQEIRKSEIKVLQEQINPHFLYNTLTSIIWLANSDKKNEVIQMVSSLSKFFRISLSNGRELITLEEEIEQVNSYLIIQNIRYKNQFDYRFDIIGDIMRINVLKLILQPLVENTLYHGLSGLERKISIIIRAFEEAGLLVLEVMDNGAGIESTRLEHLNMALSGKETDFEFGVGTKNVNGRLKLYYGIEYGLSYRMENGWTIARIILPHSGQL